jgi:hypothetical protein
MQRGLAGGRTSGPAQAWDRLETNLGWDDVAMPVSLTAALRQIPARFSERYWTGSTAELEQDPEAKRSLVILFSGPGPAEKAEVARVLGAELQLPVWRADLASVFSRGRAGAMVQVARLFGAARRAGAVLLLEGVEPLLSGGRDESPVTAPSPADVRDILRRCEAHLGLVILAAGGSAAIAPAVRERIDLMLEFPGLELAEAEPAQADPEPVANGSAPPAVRKPPPVDPEPVANGSAPPAVREPSPVDPAGPRPVRTINTSAPAATAPAPGHRQRLLLMALLAVASAVALGVAAAAERHTPAPAAPKPVELSAAASSGPLALAYPAAWRSQAPPALAGLSLSHALALTSASTPAGQLVLGTASPATATPLPTAFIAHTLPGRPTPELVSLGAHRFYRVLDPRLELGDPSASVYALSSGGQTVVAVCRTAARAFVAMCERVLATLRVTPARRRAATASTLTSPNAAYARDLDRALVTLSRARNADEHALATAPDALAQSKAAAALARDHARAAGALAGLRVSGAAARANAALVAALRQLSSAYTALSEAALAVRPVDYTTATHSVAAASKAFTGALARLRGLGFVIR